MAVGFCEVLDCHNATSFNETNLKHFKKNYNNTKSVLYAMDTLLMGFDGTNLQFFDKKTTRSELKNSSERAPLTVILDTLVIVIKQLI